MHQTASARIGPNAISQTVEVLRERYGVAEAARVLAQSGQAELLDHPPTTMVDEADFHRLVHALMGWLGSEQTAAVLFVAGERTARYLLRHRIPPLFQGLVILLPRRTGLRLFLLAISRHAWTFAGSGVFRFTMKQRPIIHVLVSFPSVRPVAHFYGGTFSHLLRTLIDQQIDVQISTTHLAEGIDCTYTLTFSSGQRTEHLPTTGRGTPTERTTSEKHRGEAEKH